MEPILMAMTPLFKQQCSSFKKNIAGVFSGLVLAQSPEAALILINKIPEMFLADSPKLIFAFLYPLYCFASSVSSVLTLKALLSQPTSNASHSNLPRVSSSLLQLFLTSMGIGLVMIPATLAFIIPGIYVLSRYLFLPFLVFVHPSQKLDWYFSESTKLFHNNKGLCFLTAFFSFLISGLSFLGISLIQKLVSLSDGMAFLIELFLGLLFSLFLNTWSANLFLEISKNERTS